MNRNKVMNFGGLCPYHVETARLFMVIWAIMAPLTLNRVKQILKIEMEFNGLVSLEFICQLCIGPKQKKTFSNEKSFKIGCLAKMGNDWYKKNLVSFLHDSINF